MVHWYIGDAGQAVYQVTEELGPNVLVFIYLYMLYIVENSMDVKKNDWV